ncbi:MAG: hypothetical protein QOD32_3267, partial [Pyrinomonadaceae bacterium]|nr:hypothetical protein [Pyrinomonadaceae bacterium]
MNVSRAAPSGYDKLLSGGGSEAGVDSEGGGVALGVGGGGSSAGVGVVLAGGGVGLRRGVAVGVGVGVGSVSSCGALLFPASSGVGVVAGGVVSGVGFGLVVAPVAPVDVCPPAGVGVLVTGVMLLSPAPVGD